VIGLQTTTPDAAIVPGDTINILVSDGPPPVVIPDVRDETRDAAKRMLEELGLVVEFSSRFSDLPGARVTSTEPAVGTSVSKGSTVTLRLQFSISD